jgi:hypothetical protein
VDAFAANTAVENSYTKCLEALHGNVRDGDVERDGVALGNSVEPIIHTLERYVSDLINRREPSSTAGCMNSGNT